MTSDNAPLVFIDCETSGLDARRHEIWELALIRRGSDGVETEHLWQFPIDESKADLIALNIGRYFERRWDGDKLVYPRWSKMIEIQRITRGCHLVGAVPSFDEERLRRLMLKSGVIPAWHYHLIDIEALMVGWLHGAAYSLSTQGTSNPRPKPPWRSKKLSEAVGVDPSKYDAHTAMGDALWARDVYDKIVGR